MIFNSFLPDATAWLPSIEIVLLKSVVVFAVAALMCLLLRKAAASARHTVWLLSLVGVLALPLLSVALPSWEMPFFKSQPQSTASLSVPTTSSEQPLGAHFTFAPQKEAPRVAASTFNWTAVVFGAWLCGATLLGLRLLHGLWQLRGLRHQSASTHDARLWQVLREAESSTRIDLRVSGEQHVSVPLTWGWRRPVVLLPHSSLSWSSEQLRSVLWHELSHIRRRDWASQMFAQWVCVLFWFHPLVWLAARRLQIEAELACDDRVLSLGISPPQYAAHLLEVVKSLGTTPSTPMSVALFQTTRKDEDAV